MTIEQKLKEKEASRIFRIEKVNKRKLNIQGNFVEIIPPPIGDELKNPKIFSSRSFDLLKNSSYVLSKMINSLKNCSK